MPSTLTVHVIRPATLDDIARLASEMGYQSALIEDSIGRQLNVLFPETTHAFWISLTRTSDGTWYDLWYDNPDDYRQIEVINPGAIFVVLHYLNVRVYLLPLIRELLRRYDGFVECGSLAQTYNADTVLTIPPECG